jgi:hypothetical protein
MSQLTLAFEAQITTEAFVEHIKHGYLQDNYIVFSSSKPLPIGELIPLDAKVRHLGVRAVLEECRWLVTGVATPADIYARADHHGGRYWYRAIPTD